MDWDFSRRRRGQRDIEALDADYPTVHRSIKLCDYSTIIPANIVSDFRHSFAWLKSFDADILLTQHPYNADLLGRAASVKAGAPNPFVNQGDLRRYVDAAEKDFNAELARQSAMPSALR